MHKKYSVYIGCSFMYGAANRFLLKYTFFFVDAKYLSSSHDKLMRLGAYFKSSIAENVFQGE